MPEHAVPVWMGKSMVEHKIKYEKVPEIIYDAHLVDDVVFKGMADRERNGDLSLYEEYHKLRDAIYDIEQEMRPKKFRDLDSIFFHHLDYDRFLMKTLDEFPDIKGNVEEVHVRRATTKQNEGSNLVDDGKKVLIRLYSDQFIEGKKICRVLRHELMHVSDMMDKGFGYNAEPFDCPPMEERIIRDRYRLFWDIYIGGRLERDGREGIATREDRKKEFDSFFGKVPEKTRDLIFEKIWEGKEPLTHNQMVEMSKDIKKTVEIAGSGNTNNLKEETERAGPSHGTTCPFCGFPTSDWVDDMGNSEDIVKAVREDFPDWDVRDSVCSRCAEYYKLKTGKW